MTEDRAALVGRLAKSIYAAHASQYRPDSVHLPQWDDLPSETRWHWQNVALGVLKDQATALAMQPPGYDAKEHALVFLQSECAAQLAAKDQSIAGLIDLVRQGLTKEEAAEQRAEAAMGLLADIREAADRIVNLSDSEMADGDEARRVCIQITDKIDALAGSAAEVKS